MGNGRKSWWKLMMVAVALLALVGGGVWLNHYTTQAEKERLAKLQKYEARELAYIDLARRGLVEMQAIVDEDLKKRGPMEVHVTDTDGTKRVETQDKADFYAPRIKSVQEDIGRLRERLNQSRQKSPKGILLDLPKPREVCHEVLECLRLTAKSHIDRSKWPPEVQERRLRDLLNEYYALEKTSP